MKSLHTKTERISGYLAKAFFLIIIGMSAFTQQVRAQASYKFMAGSEIKVNGTSSMHDWSMTSTIFLCDASMTVKNGQLQDVSSLNFNFPIKSLKSKESQMETRAYKALNEEQHSMITFKLTDATAIPQQKIVKATGNLTINGVTKEIVIQTAYTMNADESITFKGIAPVKMTDFKLKPVSMMLGAIKTGNEVKIEILLKLKKSNTAI